MKRNALKWTVIGGAMAIIVMYGIEMSSSGIERIYGPMEGGSEYTEYATPLETTSPAEELMNIQQQKIAQLEKDLAELKRLSAAGGSYASKATEELPLMNDRLPGVPLETSQPAVNRIADSTSGLLQNMSSNGIRMVVSIFDGLTK
ncbi:hypothetical protein BK133_12575 [Paenibacillus sp. FSL H8-0548]|uniref:hypothetical protein n=1 Tax=Paenibacillus sp. FSL H8-0548 TaxID=1920422 RepID=UPI00096D6DFD|nr:hypothetical protein [Paenibacillus sp. FSL H8-0548]OMF34157.1 hypothetical protein BK133_12575 [Paenibacillus sp. FSL H8-0548]